MHHCLADYTSSVIKAASQLLNIKNEIPHAGKINSLTNLQVVQYTSTLLHIIVM